MMQQLRPEATRLCSKSLSDLTEGNEDTPKKSDSLHDLHQQLKKNRLIILPPPKPLPRLKKINLSPVIEYPEQLNPFTEYKGPVNQVTGDNGQVDANTISGPVKKEKLASGPVDLESLASGPVDLESLASGPVDLKQLACGPVELIRHGPVDHKTPGCEPVNPKKVNKEQVGQPVHLSDYPELLNPFEDERVQDNPKDNNEPVDILEPMTGIEQVNPPHRDKYNMPFNKQGNPPTSVTEDVLTGFLPCTLPRRRRKKRPAPQPPGNCRPASLQITPTPAPRMSKLTSD